MTMKARLCAMLHLSLLVAAQDATAQGYSLLASLDAEVDESSESIASLWGEERQPLFQRSGETPGPGAVNVARRSAQSLFVGQASHGLFAPSTRRAEDDATPPRTGSHASAFAGDPQVALVLDLIAKAEAGRDGYDAVQHGARRKPAGRPTNMTLGEIFAWIKATPRQPHAIGRYQFIPATLARLVTILDAGPDELFTPQLQDQLAYILLEEAGVDDYRANQISRTEFMNNLSKIWAGLPNSSGRSHYHGFAGNAATMSWAGFDAEMQQIFQG